MNKTVLVPDGYNGHTVRMLRCAVPGKEYLIRWIGKDQLAALLEAQCHEDYR